MKIELEEARRIAGLARLELDDAALVRLAGEMTKILTYIDQLREVDVEGFEEHSASTATPFREDVQRPSLDRAAVERNAAQTGVSVPHDAQTGVSAPHAQTGVSVPHDAQTGVSEPHACSTDTPVCAVCASWNDGFFVVPKVIGGE